MNIADHAITAGAVAGPDHVADGDTISFGELYRPQPAGRRAAAWCRVAPRRRCGPGAAEPAGVLRNHLGLPAFRAVLHRRQHPLHADEVAYVIDDSDAKAVFVDASMADSRRICAVPMRASTCTSQSEASCPAGSPTTTPRRQRAKRPSRRRLGDAVLVGHHRTAQGRSPGAPADGNGSWAQSVLEMALIHKYGMSPASVYLSPAPMYHAAGVNYTMGVNRVGAAAIIMRKFDAEAALRFSPSAGTTCSGPGSMREINLQAGGNVEQA